MLAIWFALVCSPPRTSREFLWHRWVCLSVFGPLQRFQTRCHFVCPKATDRTPSARGKTHKHICWSLSSHRRYCCISFSLLRGSSHSSRQAERVVVVMYVFEIIYRDEMNGWLAVHHVVTILWGCAASAMYYETLDLVRKIGKITRKQYFSKRRARMNRKYSE